MMPLVALWVSLAGATPAALPSTAPGGPPAAMLVGAASADSASADSVLRPSATPAGSSTPATTAPAESAAGRASPAVTGGPGAPVRGDTLARAADYLWVVRTALLSRESVARVVRRARDMGVRGLLVQVVGRGDAWYRSDLLPRPEALTDTTFDPLGELLPLAHAAGLEVHAWMNCALIWSAPHPPRDPRHVLRQHPEWVVRLRDGRSMARMSARERERMRVEGVFLNPAHAGVRTWIARVAREIVERYPVDGVHLDYIREPGVSLESDPGSRVGFALEHGMDPERLDRLPPGERAGADSLWRAWQAEQVSAVVREVRDSLSRVRPRIALSAAVLANTVEAERHRAQPWMAWLRSGLIDRAFVMCYAAPVQTVLEQMLFYAMELGTDGRVVPGIAVYNTAPSAVAAKIKGALALGYRTLALYSYDALYERAGYWERLRSLVGP